MASSLPPLVLQAAFFSSLAIVLLLATRTSLRRQLGASLVYQAWLLVPLVVLATLLPQRSAPQILHIEALRPVQALVVQAAPNAFPQQANMLLWVWACGAVAAALWFAASHHAFLRRAGRLIREGDVHIGAPGVGPASRSRRMPSPRSPTRRASRASWRRPANSSRSLPANGASR